MTTAIAFKEVYDFLNLLGKEYINKIPSKMYSYICENKDENYITNIHEYSNYNYDISNDALEILTYINLLYWCNEKDRTELLKKY